MRAALILVTSLAVVGCLDFGDVAQPGGPGPGGTAALGSGSPPSLPPKVVALYREMMGMVRQVELVRAGRVQAQPGAMENVLQNLQRDDAELRKLGYTAEPPKFALTKL